MTLYVSSSLTIEVGVELFALPPKGTLVVKPTLDAEGFVNFSVATLLFNATSPARQTFTMLGVSVHAYSRLQFELSGAIEGYTKNNQLFEVQARELYVVSLTAPSRMYVGTKNSEKITLSLETGTPFPLSSSLDVKLITGSPCLSLHPARLTWDSDSTTVLYSKEITLEAKCNASNVAIIPNITSAPPNLRFLLPAKITLTILPLQIVSVTNPSVKSNDYSIFVGGNSLDFRVALPEPLSLGETMTVTAVYDGVLAAVKITNAFWSPTSTTVSATGRLLITPVALSERALLRFAFVAAPPRFDTSIVGGGYLEVLGPKIVTGVVPAVMIAGQNYSCQVTAEELCDSDGPICVSPVWEGDARAFFFDPATVCLFGTNACLDTKLRWTLVAREPSEGYTLRLAVNASTRFVTSAFDSVVKITAPFSVTHAYLPRELEVGKKYTLGINITARPTVEVVKVSLLTDSYFGCLDVNPLFVVFSSSAALVQNVTVSVLHNVNYCQDRFIAFSMTSTSASYSSKISPRYFSVVSTCLLVDWTQEAYVGSVNAVPVTVTLLEAATTLSALSVQISGGATATPPLLSFAAGNTTASFLFAGTQPLSAGFSFAAVAGWPCPCLPTKSWNVKFNPLISLTRTDCRRCYNVCRVQQQTSCCRRSKCRASAATER